MDPTQYNQLVKTFFSCDPQGISEIFQQTLDGTLSAEQYERYMDETHRLFERREKAMGPGLDARLGFTTSTGFCPNGTLLPAWKAVIFNPKTNVSVLDRLIASLEDL